MAKQSTVEDFVKGLCIWVKKHFQQIDGDAYRKLLKNVALLFLSGATKVLNLRAEREDANGRVLEVLPPVSPKELYPMPPRDFNCMVAQQSKGLRISIGEDVIDRIQISFRAFKGAVRAEGALWSRIINFPDTASFEEAWISVEDWFLHFAVVLPLLPRGRQP